MDMLDRRRHLTVRPNPDAKLDYVSTVTGGFTGTSAGSDVRIELRYVPDRVILEAESFATYLENLAVQPWESVEQLATMILDDINNEVIARWVQISVEFVTQATDRSREHRVFVQDSQPNWKNPDLLQRLERH